MAHIIINPSLSAAIRYNFFNPPNFSEVSAILEPANSTRMDYRVPRDSIQVSTFLQHRTRLHQVWISIFHLNS